MAEEIREVDVNTPAGALEYLIAQVANTEMNLKDGEFRRMSILTLQRLIQDDSEVVPED